MEARHCPPPGGWAVCGGGGGGGGRGGWSERRAGSGKLPPPSRPPQAGVGPAGRPARLGHCWPGRPSAGAARRGLARPLARRSLRSRGPPGTPPSRGQRRHRPAGPGRRGGGGGRGGREPGGPDCAGRPDPPWLPWTLRAHPRLPQPAPSARGSGGPAGGSGAARPALGCRGGRVPAATAEPASRPARRPPRGCHLRAPAPLGAPGRPPRPHRIPNRDKLSHPGRPLPGPRRGAVRLASAECPSTHAGRLSGAGTRGEAGGQLAAGEEEPGGASPKARVPPSGSLSLGQEEPTYLEKAGARGSVSDV